MTTLKLLTVKEISAALGVTQNQVYSYIRGGRLNSLKMGGSRRFTHQHLEDFVKGFENETKG